MISESVYRSGSAPPTVEGSLSAAGGLSEELRSDPAYVSYYYSNVNLNPRLPPPLLSREDWRAVQGRRGGPGLGGIGDRRKENGARVSGGLGFSENGKVEGEWGGDGLIGLPGFGTRQKSIAEIIQEDMSHAALVHRHPSRSVSRNSLDSNFDDSQIYATTLGTSLSRSITPDVQLVARVPSPRIPPIGRMNSMDKRIVTGPNLYDDVPAGMNEPDTLVSAFSSLTLSTNGVVDEELPSRPYQNFFPGQDYNTNSSFNSGGSSPSNSYNLDSPNSLRSYGLGGYSINPGSPSMVPSPTSNLPPLFENAAAASLMGVPNFDSRGFDLGPNVLSATTELHNLNRAGSRNVDLMHLQYLRRNQFAAAGINDPTILQEGTENSYSDLAGLQRAYLEALLLSQKAQYGLQYHGKSGNLCNNSYPRCGVGMSYPVIRNSPMGSCGPARYDERNIRFPSGFRNIPGGMMGSWHPEVGGNMDEHFMSSLLDEFKSNKTRCFELSEIVGHVVEFSADQYGSRFIQQKLETATAEEINLVFNEIMPQALSLMTDVFGNYVVQKFFEHGTPSQIRELSNQLIGHVLTFSLQMYGCRVIQKAIEVVELDLQKEMVAELDGHIMRCIRDQNGNHVIQKCIECIPEDAIQFIITVFYDQVVTLSTHPYGCRVIQRVLEHCHDPTTQSKVMDEIMNSVCSLAQDQYGNYVVQHVLEHGKPEERTAIINKLIGQIVHMSQQKFASNVVEKCLTFGTPSERQALVNEMLGSTDENDHLQVMMKDQFANYVVQKVLETCDDQQLESILNRIKDHLNTLKKYTYGKHIVARVEKLVIAGERRISFLTSSNSA